MRARFAVVACLMLVLVAACGGDTSETSTTQPEQPAASSGSEAAGEPQHGMQVEGILGTIPARKVEDTLSGKLPAFQRCFFEGSADVEFLAGAIKLYFRVGLDGTVEYVHLRESSVGHRGTELCLLGLAKRTRFPKPQGGGAAEVAWGFELDSPGGVRAPVAWDAARVTQTVSANRASLEGCALGAARYSVTAYVSPGGAVLAAGAAVDSQAGADKIDCLVDAVKTWHMPDPGSYAAKVTFEL